MKLIIDVPDDTKNRLCFGITYQKDIQTICEVLNNGTPIPDNATFGDVIEKITNRKLLEDNKDAENIIISTKLWNAPYQKGGK